MCTERAGGREREKILSEIDWLWKLSKGRQTLHRFLQWCSGGNQLCSQRYTVPDSMANKQFNIGPSYGLTAEVKNRIAQKYDDQKEEELRIWIEEITGKQIGDNFQKGLKDGSILCELINKIQPNSVKKINRSALNWHQLENVSNFIKAMQNYGIKPHDTFEANDLFENGNLTQVQTALLALAGMAKTKGMHAGVDIGVKYADKKQRSFDQETLNAGQCVIGLQMGTNKCASQTGMAAYGTRRHLYDPRAKIPTSVDQSTISLQMGTNKGASQAGMTAPGTRRPIYDKKLGTEQCDNSTVSLQMGSNQGANQSGTNFGLGRQIYNPKYCPKAQPGQNGGHSNHSTEYIPEHPADYPEQYN